MMRMRIIGGEFRGCRIEHPSSAAVRPTKDRVREAVFDMIAPNVPGAAVLDLFAGSGAYGLEALSRGAEKAVLVERDKACVETIAKNIETLGVSGRADLIAGEAIEFIEKLGAEKESFDIVFSDPPYNIDMGKKTLITINHYDILKPFGLLIIEHHRAESIPESEGNVSILKQRTYGDISVSVFRKR